MKRADKSLNKIRSKWNREDVSDLLTSGDRIWSQLKSLVRACADYTLKITRRHRNGDYYPSGEKGSIEFVESIFGRDRELKRTEQAMADTRHWNVSFDSAAQGIMEISRPDSPVSNPSNDNSAVLERARRPYTASPGRLVFKSFYPP